MQKLTFIIITVLFLFSCKGNTDKTGARETAGSDNETSQVQQEKAVKEKYLRLGQEIASATQAELLKVVQGAMVEGGPAYAVKYCNLEALELKDSLSALNHCTIQRLSAKYRNPADKPVSETETEQLDSFEKQYKNGEALSPAVHIIGNEVEYYQPILIGAGACLLCHGDPATQIADATMNMINKLYPNDLATGYKMNDFRGAWKITFLH